jgi:hypothetical protein
VFNLRLSTGVAADLEIDGTLHFVASGQIKIKCLLKYREGAGGGFTRIHNEITVSFAYNISQNYASNLAQKRQRNSNLVVRPKFARATSWEMDVNSESEIRCKI